MMSSVENFLNRSYPRFASTTTTNTADPGQINSLANQLGKELLL